MSYDRAFQCAFNVLCGKLIGEGIHREVYACRLDPSLVVKVEIDREWRSFSNVKEHDTWQHWQSVPAVARWLAPCEQLSPDGRVLLQRRAEPLPANYQLPDKLPAFLADIKSENFGLLQGRLVCLDYAYVNPTLPTRLRKVTWTPSKTS